MTKYLLCLFSCLSCFQAMSNDSVNGKVISVLDGNTIEVVGEDKENHVVMLAGIDSPELTQEYGEKAKKYLEKMLLEKKVIVHFQGKDRKGNKLAVVLLKGEIDARIELLKVGLAWTSEKDPLPELEVHRTEAQEKGRGLWKEENPTPPWTYRRQQTMLHPKSS
jgi:micrococcal nuclease